MYKQKANTLSISLKDTEIQKLATINCKAHLT